MLFLEEFVMLFFLAESGRLNFKQPLGQSDILKLEVILFHDRIFPSPFYPILFFRLNTHNRQDIRRRLQ